MASRTRTRTAAAKPAEETAKTEDAPVVDDEAAKAEKATAAAKKAEQAEVRKQERDRQESEQLDTLLKRFGEHPRVPNGIEGEESLGAVAKDLNITAGKAAFILMKDAVAKGKIPAITGADEDALLVAINDARLVADDFSSWGWLAARASKPEGWIKSGLAEKGLFTPKAENIATKRAEQNKPEPAPEGEKTEGGAAPAAGRRRRRGNA